MKQPIWVFGYGSLLYKVDFPYIDKKAASITGWARRFWQGSHDHRGLPHAPGRVVTLIPEPGVVCKGVAYLVEHTVFEHLDDREKNGYQRVQIDLLFTDGESVTGLVYVAEEGNHAYLGPAPMQDIAAQIACSSGPSGSNRDYLFSLAQALRDISEHDEHVFTLESLLSVN